MKTNEILENIKARRSVRAYTGQQVSEEDLQAVLEAATYAPSGMHLETWHFTAIQNADKLTELNERIKGAFAKSDEPRLKERGRARRIVAIIMLLLWLSFLMSRLSGGRVWTVPVLSKICFLRLILWGSVLVG